MSNFNKVFKNNKPSAESKASFIRIINAKIYIVANCILGDWNDPSRILNEKSMILDIISENDKPEIKTASLNKLYYDELYLF